MQAEPNIPYLKILKLLYLGQQFQAGYCMCGLNQSGIHGKEKRPEILTLNLIMRES